MHSIEQIRKNKLKETEKHLEQMGCTKCSICGYWMDKEELYEHNKEQH